MTKINNSIQNKIFQTIVKISLVSLVLAAALFQFFTQPAKAAALSNMKDTSTRLKVSTLADHDLRWTIPSTFGPGDKAMVYFGGGTFVADAGWTTADFTFDDGTLRTVVDVGVDVDPVCTGGVNDVAIRIETMIAQFDIWACPGYTASALGASVTFTIAGTAPNGTLTNPGVAATYQVYLVGDDKANGFNADDDNGYIALAIVDDDQVQITATVDPTFSFSLSANSCNLGSLTTSNVKACTYVSTVSTNAADGYVATIRAESDGANINLNNDADPTEFIDNVADFEITAGSEEYGFAISSFSFGFPPSFNGDEAGCNEDSGEPGEALTSSPRTYAGWAGPVTGHTETLCHIASISAISEAGTYRQTVTLIATGRF